MSSSPRLVATVVTIAAAAVAACGGNGDRPAGGLTDAEPDVSFDVVVTDGEVVGGPQAFRVESGDVVRISIESDDADTLHVHGVDVEVDLDAGETSDVTFQTGASGSYEVELHDASSLVGTLEVR